MTPKINHQRGQSLVLVAIMMLGMLAILGLVLDGGNFFFKRRAAQNAADAGALAGARTLCVTKDSGQAVTQANQYATVYNEASTAAVGIVDRVVTVTTTIPIDTYFAQFIGWDTVTAQAEAAAGCFNPTTGQGVLPIAWICRPPVNPLISSSTDCQVQALTEPELNCRLNNPYPYCLPPGTYPPSPIYPELYVVMDSASLPDDLTTVCISGGGTLNCDLDGDGDDDLIANGGRSWLDLDGSGGGASSLVDWLINGFNGTIEEHYWLGGQTGVANSVFQAAADRIGSIVAVPVYDVFCDGLPSADCPGLVHTGNPNDTIITTAGAGYYYHIIGFAGFYITCVDAPGVPGHCPGHDRAVDLGVIDANTKTIEGYFVTGVFTGLGGGSGGGGIDMGAYTLYLTR